MSRDDRDRSLEPSRLLTHPAVFWENTGPRGAQRGTWAGRLGREMPGQPFGGPLQSPGPGEGTAGPQGVLSNPQAQGLWKLQAEKPRASPHAPFCRPSLSMPPSFSAPCLPLPLISEPTPSLFVFLSSLPGSLCLALSSGSIVPLCSFSCSLPFSGSVFLLILKLSPFASPLYPPPLSVSICFSLSIAPDPGSPDCCPPPPAMTRQCPSPSGCSRGGSWKVSLPAWGCLAQQSPQGAGGGLESWQMVQEK